MKKKKQKTFKSLKATLWRLFSEYVRKRDADLSGLVACYTCGSPIPWKESQCGHAIGGRHHAVLFDADICRPQCVRCNVFMRGNYPVFAMNLIRENGIGWFEKKLAGARQAVKLTSSDLEEMIQSYKAKLA